MRNARNEIDLPLRQDLRALRRDEDQEAYRPVVNGLVDELIRQRTEARGRKDYAAADAIRNSLSQLGIVIEDTPRGSRWSLDAPST